MFTEACDCKNGIHFPYVDPGEVRYVKKDCHNPNRIDTPTCKDPEINTFMDEVGGLNFDTQLSNGVYALPPYIPTLDYRSRTFRSFNQKHYPVVAVTLQDILRSGGVVKKAGALHEHKLEFRLSALLSPAFRRKKTILFLTGPDTLIEWVWYQKNEIRLYKTLAAMGFYAVVGFNFSVIDGECPWSHAFAQKKSFVSSQLAEAAGLRVIPHVYSTNEHHVARYVDWFQGNPNIKFCAINCQLQDRPEDIATLIHNVKEILRQVPYLHVILQGMRINQVPQFGDYLPRIHLAEKSPIKDAQFGKKLDLSLESLQLKRTWKRSGETIEQLAFHNVNYRKAYFELLRQEYAEAYNVSPLLIEELLLPVDF
jgi:hypothetical protein